MNTLLTLRGKSFTPKSAKGGGPITIPADSIVTLNHLNELYTSTITEETAVPCL